MTHRIASLAALVLAAATASAAPITPAQALAMARDNGPRRVPAADARAPRPALTLKSPDTGSPAVYCFNLSGGGYLVTAADDAVSPVVLGYADEGSIDPEAMPDALEWWLQHYAASIGTLAASGATFSAPQRAREEIPYMCQANWNQSAPYNNLCPLVGGRSTYAGCVAVAMAQVMYVHRWPEQCRGGEFTYTFNSGGSNYTITHDFDSQTIDWAHILPAYGSGADTAERRAIAELMYDCGVASRMIYGTSGSGSYSWWAAEGMHRFLGYDPSLQYLMREWYTAEEWDDLVYGELAAGRPLYMSGDNGSVGHAYVCDGCNGGPYYHINWGWGGSSNGYFLLSNLAPSGTGIGGGAAGTGYDQNVAIIYNCRPDEGGRPVPCVMMDGVISVSPAEGDNSVSAVTIGSTPHGQYYYGGLLSFSPGTYAHELGVRLEDPEGNSIWVKGPVTTAAVDSYTYIDNIVIDPADIPVGVWSVYPAARIAGCPDWADIHATVDFSPRYLTCVRTADAFSFSPGAQVQEPRATWGARECAEPTDGLNSYPGHTYTYRVTVDVDGPWALPVRCVLAGAGSPQLIEAGPELPLSTPGGTLELAVEVTLPESLAPGNYVLALARERLDGDDGFTLLPGMHQLTVSELGLDMWATFDIDGVASDGSGELTCGAPYTLQASVTPTLDYSGSLRALLLRRGTVRYNVVAHGDEVAAATAAYTPGPCRLPITIPAGVAEGDYYLSVGYTAPDGTWRRVSDTPRRYTLKAPAGAPLPEASDGASPAVVYDLLGRPVDPATALPGVYITPSRKLIRL